MIEATKMRGVYITQLNIIRDDRGSVMKMLDENSYVGEKYFKFDRDLGEIYFSTIKGGVVKGWHGHEVMTLNYACVYGRVLIGLADMRSGPTFCQTAQVWLDANYEYKLLTVPPGVWNGIKSYCDYSIIANAASHRHRKDEITRMHPDKFPVSFVWGDYEVAG